MPIVANPAGPFAPQINSKFAAAEQFNKIFPQLAGLAEAQGRNYTQASAQTAQNQTQASAVSAGLEARNIAQQRQIEAEREQQFFQARAQMEMQARQQQMEMERMNFKITRQEENENTMRMNGLVEIERQLREKLITPEQAGDARSTLITGINAFQHRQQFQQAQSIKQQENMRSQQFANMKKDEASADAFEAKMIEAGVGVLRERDAEGQPMFLIKNRMTGEWYNPKVGGGGGGKGGGEKHEPVGPYDDGHSGFSYKKAWPEAKAEAESAYPVMKGDDGKDKNAEKRMEYAQEVMGRYQDEHRAGMQAKSRARSGQNDQVKPPSGQNDQVGQAEQIKQQLRAIQSQYPNGNAPPEVKQQHAALLAQLKSMSQ